MRLPAGRPASFSPPQRPTRTLLLWPVGMGSGTGEVWAGRVRLVGAAASRSNQASTSLVPGPLAPRVMRPERSLCLMQRRCLDALLVSRDYSRPGLSSLLCIHDEARASGRQPCMFRATRPARSQRSKYSHAHVFLKKKELSSRQSRNTNCHQIDVCAYLDTLKVPCNCGKEP
jgi:hypothetical protein